MWQSVTTTWQLCNNYMTTVLQLCYKVDQTVDMVHGHWQYFTHTGHNSHRTEAQNTSSFPRISANFWYFYDSFFYSMTSQKDIETNGQPVWNTAVLEREQTVARMHYISLDSYWGGGGGDDGRTTCDGLTAPPVIQQTHRHQTLQTLWSVCYRLTRWKPIQIWENSADNR